MRDDELLTRIYLDPKIMVGKPIIRGTRLTVEYILNLLAHGATVQEILSEYAGLAGDDIQAAAKIEAVRQLLDRYPDHLAERFVVVTENRIRFARR